MNACLLKMLIKSFCCCSLCCRGSGWFGWGTFWGSLGGSLLNFCRSLFRSRFRTTLINCSWCCRIDGLGGRGSFTSYRKFACLKVFYVLLSHAQVISHALTHLCQQLLVFLEACQKKLLLAFELGSIKDHLWAHFVHLAPLLHSFNQLWDVFQCHLNMWAGCVKFLNEFLWMPIFLFTLIDRHHGIFTLKVIHFLEQNVQVFLISSNLLHVEKVK